MNNLNSILIEGVLVRDPELSFTPRGTPICKFQLSSRRFARQEDKIEEELSCFEVSCQSRLAEVCAEYLKKGRGVRVVGRLKQERLTNEAGLPCARVYIVAEHVDFKPQPRSEPKADEEEEPQS